MTKKSWANSWSRSQNGFQKPRAVPIGKGPAPQHLAHIHLRENSVEDDRRWYNAKLNVTKQHQTCMKLFGHYNWLIEQCWKNKNVLHVFILFFILCCLYSTVDYYLLMTYECLFCQLVRGWQRIRSWSRVWRSALPSTRCSPTWPGGTSRRSSRNRWAHAPSTFLVFTFYHTARINLHYVKRTDPYSFRIRIRIQPFFHDAWNFK